MVIGYHKNGFFVAPIFSLINKNVELMSINKLGLNARLMYYADDTNLMNMFLQSIVDYQEKCFNGLEDGQIPDMTVVSDTVTKVNDILDSVKDTACAELSNNRYDYTPIVDFYGLYEFHVSTDGYYNAFTPNLENFFSRQLLANFIHPKCIVNDLNDLEQHKQFLGSYILMREAYLANTMYTLTYILNFTNVYKQITEKFGKITLDNLQSKIVEILVQQSADTDTLSAYLLVFDAIKYQGFKDHLQLIEDIQNVSSLDEIKKFYETIFV